MNDRANQAAARSILRALYAPDQLPRSAMTWFWFNHSMSINPRQPAHPDR